MTGQPPSGASPDGVNTVPDTSRSPTPGCTERYTTRAAFTPESRTWIGRLGMVSALTMDPLPVPGSAITIGWGSDPRSTAARAPCTCPATGTTTAHPESRGSSNSAANHRRVVVTSLLGGLEPTRVRQTGLFDESIRQ